MIHSFVQESYISCIHGTEGVYKLESFRETDSMWYKRSFILKNWFTQLWRKGSLMIFHLQPGNPEKLVV